MMIVQTLLAALILCAPATAQRRQAQPVAVSRLSDRLVEFTGGSGARTTAYIGDNGVVMVDAKMNEESVVAVFEALRTLTDAPVRWLINTHSDGDHVTGNRWFPAEIDIVAHENCRSEMLLPDRDNTPSAWTTPELAPFVPSMTYTDQMTIHLDGGTVELHHFGVGHTKGDTVVYFPDDKTAIAADQAMLGRPQLIHAYKGGNSFGNVLNLEAMLAAIPAELFLLGHNEPVTRKDIRGVIYTMKSRQAKVRRLMGEGKSQEEIRAAFTQQEVNLVEIIIEEIKEGRDW